MHQRQKRLVARIEAAGLLGRLRFHLASAAWYRRAFDALEEWDALRLRWVSGLLLVELLLLLASAATRDLLYVESYGITRVRVSPAVAQRYAPRARNSSRTRE